LISGVVGTSSPSFDLWGETVSLARQLETSGIPGEIQVDEATCEHLAGMFELEPRGLVGLKDIGPVHTCLLKGQDTLRRSSV
jgi:adenylate cyclase